MAQRRQSMQGERTGVKQVAQEAGVSTASVSRVLSHTGYASADVRARVTQAADRLGYQPDALARGLRRRKGTALGILVPDLTNPVALSFIRGVQHVAQPCGYAVAIGDAQRNADIERGQLELFESQRVAGVIMAGALLDPSGVAALGTDMPIVRSPAALESNAAAENDAINDAVSDLARLGHRSVLFVSRSPFSPQRDANTRTELRRSAVVAAAARHDMSVDHCSTPMELSTAETIRRLGRFIGKTKSGHAIICASHRLAPQLLGASADMRLTLPDELSFVSFGDSDWARAYRPAVSVIRFDRYAEARWVTYNLLVHLGESPSSEEEPSAPAYVHRASVGPCPPRQT